VLCSKVLWIFCKIVLIVHLLIPWWKKHDMWYRASFLIQFIFLYVSALSEEAFKFCSSCLVLLRWCLLLVALKDCSIYNLIVLWHLEFSHYEFCWCNVIPGRKSTEYVIKVTKCGIKHLCQDLVLLLQLGSWGLQIWFQVEEGSCLSSLQIETGFATFLFSHAYFLEEDSGLSTWLKYLFDTTAEV